MIVQISEYNYAYNNHFIEDVELSSLPWNQMHIYPEEWTESHFTLTFSNQDSTLNPYKTYLINLDSQYFISNGYELYGGNYIFHFKWEPWYSRIKNANPNLTVHYGRRHIKTKNYWENEEYNGFVYNPISPVENTYYYLGVYSEVQPCWWGFKAPFEDTLYGVGFTTNQINEMQWCNYSYMLISPEPTQLAFTPYYPLYLGCINQLSPFYGNQNWALQNRKGVVTKFVTPFSLESKINFNRRTLSYSWKYNTLTYQESNPIFNDLQETYSTVVQLNSPFFTSLLGMNGYLTSMNYPITKVGKFEFKNQPFGFPTNQSPSGEFNCYTWGTANISNTSKGLNNDYYNPSAANPNNPTVNGIRFNPWFALGYTSLEDFILYQIQLQLQFKGSNIYTPNETGEILEGEIYTPLTNFVEMLIPSVAEHSPLIISYGGSKIEIPMRVLYSCLPNILLSIKEHNIYMNIYSDYYMSESLKVSEEELFITNEYDNYINNNPIANVARYLAPISSIGEGLVDVMKGNIGGAVASGMSALTSGMDIAQQNFSMKTTNTVQSGRVSYGNGMLLFSRIVPSRNENIRLMNDWLKKGYNFNGFDVWSNFKQRTKFNYFNVLNPEIFYIQNMPKTYEMMIDDFCKGRCIIEQGEVENYLQLSIETLNIQEWNPFKG